MARRFEFWSLGIALLLVCGGFALDAAPPSTITFAVPDRTNSTPWVAASGSFVAVVWGASADGKGDVMLAVSRDSGRTFGAPVRVNDVAGDARLSGEIPPRVMLAARCTRFGWIIAASPPKTRLPAPDTKASTTASRWRRSRASITRRPPKVAA